MTKQQALKLFEEKRVRTVWDDEQEKWYFSIVDVVAILTDSPNPRKYWSVLKTRLKKEGSELTTNCSQLKMQATDGKSTLPTLPIPNNFSALFNLYLLPRQNLSNYGWPKLPANVSTKYKTPNYPSIRL